jgi:hypothetical protein
MCRRPTMRSVAACGVLRERDVYTGRADDLRCVELLPTQVRAVAVMNPRRERGCQWYCRSERSAGRTGTDVTLSRWERSRGCWLTDLACWGPYFIPFPLGWVRANWGRSWSCGRWLASACVEVRQPSGELQCIKTACAHYAVSVDQGVCLSVRLWWKQGVWPSVWLRSKQGVCLSVWLWEVPTG